MQALCRDPFSYMIPLSFLIHAGLALCLGWWDTSFEAPRLINPEQGRSSVHIQATRIEVMEVEAPPQKIEEPLVIVQDFPVDIPTIATTPKDSPVQAPLLPDVVKPNLKLPEVAMLPPPDFPKIRLPEPLPKPETPSKPKAPQEPKKLPTATQNAQASQANTGAQVDEVPLYLHNPSPPYPPQALAQGKEGVVHLVALIDAKGRVTQLRVAESSGHEPFDQAALTTVRNWLFHPAKSMGSPVGVEVTFPVRFFINRR